MPHQTYSFSSVALVVEATQVGAVLQNAEGHDGEGEDIGPGLQMAAERLVGGGQGDVRVDDAVGDEAAHAEYVGRPGGILDEDVPRGEGAVANLVDLVAAHRPHTGQDDGVRDLLLLHHFLEAGQQVGIELEAQDDDAIELGGDRVDVGYLFAQALGVVRRVGGRIGDLAAAFPRTTE